jgi:hypothetical protein
LHGKYGSVIRRCNLQACCRPLKTLDQNSDILTGLSHVERLFTAPTLRETDSLASSSQMSRLIRPALLTSLSVLLFQAPLQAYLDPGSGSMLLQLLLGGIAGIAVIFQLFWRRILSVLGIRSSPPEDDRNVAP